jgi:hypothetical protein
MNISLQHPGTHEVKILPQGWSWSCFFGATFLGLPLFKRGLIVWGSAMLAFDVVTLIIGWVDTDAAASLYFWLSLIGLAASVFFGIKANDMAAQRALSYGWEIADRRRKWLD